MTDQVDHHTFDKPDEVRYFPNGKLELVKTADGEVGRAHFEPGWRWSEHIKPIAQTEHCQVKHVGYQLQGTRHVKMADGTEFETVSGEVSTIPPGHDAWVVGDETVIMVDWAGFSNYAVPK